MALQDSTSPCTTVKELGVDLRYFGGHVIIDGACRDIATYAQEGGCITLTAGAVRPSDVTKRKGMCVSPDCERLLYSGQQFLVQGELYSVLGLLWIGFGKPFKQRNSETSARTPKAPLLVMVIPTSCVDLGEHHDDIRIFLPHLACFTAHHVLTTAVFPAETIRRNDVLNMARLFLEICNKYHKQKQFWGNMSILKTPREEEVARETLRRSTRPRSKPAVLCMDAPPRNNKKKPSPRPPAPSSGSLRSNSTGSSGLHSSFASSHIAEQLSKIVQQQQQFQRQVLKDMRQRQSPPTPAVQPVTIQQPNPTQHRPPKNNKRKRDKHDRRAKKK